MTDSKKTAQPETMSDDALDAAAGGGLFSKLGEGVNGPLKAQVARFAYDDDGNLKAKTLIAQASGSGNIAGGSPAGTATYVFDEEVDGDFVPVTYKLS